MECADQVREVYLPKLETYQLLTYLAHCFEYPWRRPSRDFLHTTQAIFQMELNAFVEIPPLEEQQEDYTRLFISHIPHTLAPPYEAFYVENDLGVLSRLNHWYSRLGYVCCRERGDHIVAELQFLALLAEEGQKKMAYEFVEEHLYQWIVPFTEKIICNANTKYFSLMGKLAAHLIERIRREELL